MIRFLKPQLHKLLFFSLFIFLYLWFPKSVKAACSYCPNALDGIARICDNCFDASVPQYENPPANLGRCWAFDRFSSGIYYYKEYTCRIDWKCTRDANNNCLPGTLNCGVPYRSDWGIKTSVSPLNTDVQGCWLTEYCGFVPLGCNLGIQQ